MRSRLVVVVPFLTVLHVGLSVPAVAQNKMCFVTDPTDSALNVRDSPNGRKINRLRNGRQVYIQEISHDSKGRPWAYIAGYYKGHWRNWGWVYRELISCP